jgi:hypothetical protein
MIISDRMKVVVVVFIFLLQATTMEVVGNGNPSSPSLAAPLPPVQYPLKAMPIFNSIL